MLAPLVFTLLACDGGSDATYYEDTKTILDSKCATCHRPGDIGPFSLTTYDEVMAFEVSVRASIENGTMPPWQPADDCTTYLGNFDLTEEERNTLLGWLDAGAPQGDPANAPTDAPPGPSRWEASHTLQLPEPYTPVGEPDDYRCQLIPWPEDQTTYVTALRVIPDQRPIVHHTIAFLIGPEQVADFRAYDAAEEGPGYTCFGGPTPGSEGGALGDLSPADLLAAAQAAGVSLADARTGNLTPEQRMAFIQELGVADRATGFTVVGSWVPGAAELPLPTGTGIKVEPGSMIVAQMHYNTQSANPVADQSTIEVAVSDTVQRPGVSVQMADLGWLSNGLVGEPMTIPAGDSSVTHSTTIAADSMFFEVARSNLGIPPGEPLLIHQANHHMHELGAWETSVVVHEDGTATCLLDTPDWDFNWQGSYLLADPVLLESGDAIEISCNWDNSAANQPVVEGAVREPADVAWGEGTADEMCLSSVYVTAP